MKKFKKILSGILVLTMLLATISMVSVTPTMAEESKTVILDEDCSDAPVGIRADEVGETDDNVATVGEWQIIGTGNPAYDVMNPPVKSADPTGMTLQHSRVDETNAQMYAVRKLTQDITAPNLTEGVYEISFDITPSEDSWLAVSIIDTNDPTNLSAWNVTYERNMILNLVNNNSRFYANNASTGWKTQFTENTQPSGTGKIVQAKADKNIWNDSDAWKICDVEETTLIKVKAVVDMDKGTMSTYFYQNDILVGSRVDVALSSNIKTNGLGYIVFGNAHGDTKISNLIVNKVEETISGGGDNDNPEIGGDDDITEVAPEGYVLYEDCSDAPVGIRADEVGETDDNVATVGDWQIIGTGNPAYDVMNPPVKSADSTGMTLQHSRVDETNAQMYAVRKLTQDITAPNLTEGVYEISFDITPSEDSWLAVSIIDTNDPTKLSAWNANYSRNVILNLINKNSTYKENSAATGWKTIFTDDTMPEGIGHIIQPTAGNNIWNISTAWMMGVADETKPLAVKAIVNMDRGILSTYIYQDGELCATNQATTLSDNIKNNGLGYIVFGNAHGDTKISNLAVKRLEDGGSRFFGVKETFENGELFTAYRPYLAAVQNGWVSVPAEETGALAAVDLTTFDSGVLKITDPNTMNGPRMSLSTVDGSTLKGSYKISYKMLVEEGEVFMEVGHTNYSNRLVQIRLDSVDKVVRHYDSGPDGGTACLSQNKGTVGGTIEPTQWCDVELIIDVAGGQFGYTVSQDGIEVASASEQVLNDYIKQNGFNFIQMRGLNTSSAADDWAKHTPVYYIDDIKVEEYEYVEPEFENVNETFDSWTTVPGTSNWVAVGGNYKYPVLETVDGNQTLKVGPYDGNFESGIQYRFQKAITEGTLNVSYDIKVKKCLGSDGATNGHVLWPTLDADSAGGDWGSAYPDINNYNVRINRNLDADRGDAQINVATPMTEDTWYTVNISVRPAASKYDINIVEKATGNEFCSYENKNFENRLGEAQTKISTFTLRTWVGYSWIDNFAVEYIPQRPTLSNSSIKMYDCFGAQTPSITTNVTPALGTIELDFGTAMADVSGITLTGINAPEISVALDEEDSSIAVITLDGMLTAGATYVLTVPGTVTAVNGETMDSEFSLEFTAGTVATNATITGVSVGGANITTLAELTVKAGQTATVNTNAVNASNSDMKLTAVIAYYEGQKCIKVDATETITLASNTMLTEQPEFVIDNPTGTTKVKVFLWTTLNEMIPYCAGLEF